MNRRGFLKSALTALGVIALPLVPASPVMPQSKLLTQAPVTLAELESMYPILPCSRAYRWQHDILTRAGYVGPGRRSREVNNFLKREIEKMRAAA